MTNWRTAVVVLALVALILMGPLSLPASAAPSEDSVTLFSEGFEGPWPSSWTASDDLPRGGIDTWGISNNRAYGGSGSVWCAQVGEDGTGEPNAATHHYDRSMKANLIVPLGDSTGVSSLSVSFWYYADLGDGAYFTLYNWHGDDGGDALRQLSSANNSDVWVNMVVHVPDGATTLNFQFNSYDSIEVGHEGVYIDNIELRGIDDDAPISSVNIMNTYQNSPSFLVSFTTSDGRGSGVAYVELFYAHNGAKQFNKYNTSSNPDGHWPVQPILFNTATTGGDGEYEFYTVAYDSVGHNETAPSGNDASTIVDTVSPATTASVKGDLKSSGWYASPVTIELTAKDDGSGKFVTRYSFDQVSWLVYDGPFRVSSQGDNVVSFYSVDKAGNQEKTTTVNYAVDQVPPKVNINLVNGTRFDTVSPVLSWKISDDASGVKKVEIALDDEDFREFNEDRLRAVNLSEGNHILKIRAYDEAGNMGWGHIMFAVEAQDRSSASVGGLNIKLEDAVVFIVFIGAIAVVAGIVFLHRGGYLGHLRKSTPPYDGTPDVVHLLPPRKKKGKTIFVPGSGKMMPTKICPKCNHMVLVLEPTCRHCGEPLPMKPEEDEVQKKKWWQK